MIKRYRPSNVPASVRRLAKPMPKLIFPGLIRSVDLSGWPSLRNCGLATEARSNPSHVTVLVYNQFDRDSMFIVPCRDTDPKTTKVFGPRRPSQKADRIIWADSSFDNIIYVPLLTDMKEFAQKYFQPQVMAEITNQSTAKKTALDALVSRDDIVNAFCDNALALYERACVSGLVTIDDVERDYGRMQKLIALVTRGTPGEAQSAGCRVKEFIERLLARCQ